MMQGLVARYKGAGQVRQTALDLVAALRAKDWAAEVRAVFNFVRDHVRYVRDVRGIETLQTPLVTLELEQGDCDDKSTLLASLLEAIGHPTRFVAVGYGKPGQFSHVYVESRIGARWLPLDATMNVEAGWAPRAPVSRLVVHN